MKWMGWSCSEYDDAPPEMIDEIIEIINEQSND